MGELVEGMCEGCRQEGQCKAAVRGARDDLDRTPMGGRYKGCSVKDMAGPPLHSDVHMTSIPYTFQFMSLTLSSGDGNIDTPLSSGMRKQKNVSKVILTGTAV